MSEYTDQLNAKLESARKRVRQGREIKQLKAAAPSAFEIIDTEITLAVSKMTQEIPIPRDEYLSLHGQVVGMRKIRALFDSKEAEEIAAHQEVVAIEEQLETFENDKA